MIELRPYQEECIERVVEQYQRDSHGEALLVLPTGTGKTVIFCQIIYLLAQQHGMNALIVAHRDELLDQAADKYRVVKPDALIGKVGAGVHDYGGEITVASVATISRPQHLERLKTMNYGLVIIDEAHHAAAAGYQKVLGALPDAFKLMVTATPDRLDGQPISDQPPTYECTIIGMITQKYLCDVRAVAIRTQISLDAIHTKMGDYSERELDLAINTPARNKRVVEAYQEHADGRTALCFAVTVDHAYALADAFNEYGISAGTVIGETPHDERKELYKALRNGEIKVLTNVQVLTEGYDEPLVDCIIMARPTQSRALYVQCVGRGLRLAPAKKDCMILDLTDNCFKHRLQPQNLGKVLGIPLENGESVNERQEREEREERERQERMLKVRRREDVQVDILEVLEWKRSLHGLFVLEVGEEKHRITLVPSDTRDGYYRVVARMAPDFQMQEWGSEQPLSWAQQTAERRASLLKEDKRYLVDVDAPWRKYPVDPDSKQADLLRKYRLGDPDGMTKGEASDLISAKFAAIERWKKNRSAS